MIQCSVIIMIIPQLSWRVKCCFLATQKRIRIRSGVVSRVLEHFKLTFRQILVEKEWAVRLRLQSFSGAKQQPQPQRPLCGRQQRNASLTAQGSEALCCSFIWRHGDRREKATGDNADRAALSPRRRLYEEPCWFLQSDANEVLWPRNSHRRSRMNLRERAGSFFKN